MGTSREHPAVLLELRLLALVATADGWTHGYRVKQSLQEKYGSDVRLSTIYRVLDRLLKRGLLEREYASPDTTPTNMPRKLYRCTGLGVESLDRHLAEYEQMSRELAQVRAELSRIRKRANG